MFPLYVQMCDEPLRQYHIDRSIAGYLISDVQIATAGITGTRQPCTGYGWIAIGHRWLGRNRRWRRDRIADQPISAPRNGANHRSCRVPDGTPNVSDTLHKRILGHRRIIPDCSQQFFFGDELTWTFRKATEHGKGARAQQDWFPLQRE